MISAKFPNNTWVWAQTPPQVFFKDFAYLLGIPTKGIYRYMATSAFSQKLDFRCLTRFCNVSVFTPKQLPRIMTLLSWLVLKVVRRSSHWNGFLETRASKVLRNHEIQLQIEIPLKILWKELFFLQLLQTSEMWFLLKWNLSQIFSKDFTNL